MIGKCQISGREYLRWCFVVDIQKYIVPFPNVYQNPVLNTKEADVEGEETQMRGKDKEQVKNQLPASSGRIDYLDTRLSFSDREMDRMFSEDRQIQMNE